jgi:hypothetical protein
LLLAAFLGFFVGGAAAFFLYLIGTVLWHAIWARTHPHESAILKKHRAYQTAAKDFEAQQRLAQSSTMDADRELKRILRAALHISEYGAALEKPPGHSAPTANQPDTRLPFSKQQITQAVHVMQQAIEHPRLRALLIQVLSPMEAQQVLSPQFKASLETGLVLLETFVPASQVAVEQQEWQETLELLDKIDPEMRAQFEQSLSEAPGGKLGVPVSAIVAETLKKRDS